MNLDDFQYDLPNELIAQYPPDKRGASRLLDLEPAGICDRQFCDILDLVQPGDVLVVNNTRVLKARLIGTKDTGGQAELLLERLIEPHSALFQVRVSKPLKEGRSIFVGDDALECVGRQGQFYLLQSEPDIQQILECYGSMPLPPYIERPTKAEDAERYQTVFSREPGAVAAPTAGLHFDEELLAALAAKGVHISEITLHVGAGTFQPVRGDLSDHVMHEEFYSVDASAAQRISSVRENGGRVISVGTTVVRTLESVARENGGQIVPTSGSTRLFISPGFAFQVVDCLITNFHLPRSTLLMLVSAFAGYEPVMRAYNHAVSKGYRFFSYGDAMWLSQGSNEDVR
ncbi:MAG: tRNA preQ1(34) S-adenosylmethionine ribosyltransferase-isomerase QueA [Pseudomonadales bacterium]|nr:tRNA preQ1(34) S-adenosylmethionine ribosyltransferase-isomerase QueA [Pseudomonadales bacterium]